MEPVGEDRLAGALARRRAQMTASPGERWPRLTGDAAPLAPTQFGLWYANERAPGDPAHHRTTVIHIDGPVDARRLERALHTVVTRHEPLRTVYAVDPEQGGPVQIVRDRASP